MSNPTDPDELRREVRRLRRIIVRLAKVVHTHMRTDLAPDAGLPAMRELLDEIDCSTAKKRECP